MLLLSGIICETVLCVPDWELHSCGLVAVLGCWNEGMWLLLTLPALNHSLTLCTSCMILITTPHNILSNRLCATGELPMCFCWFYGGTEDNCWLKLCVEEASVLIGNNTPFFFIFSFKTFCLAPLGSLTYINIPPFFSFFFFFFNPLQTRLSWSQTLSLSQSVRRPAQRTSLILFPSQAERTPKVSLNIFHREAQVGLVGLTRFPSVACWFAK